MVRGLILLLLFVSSAQASDTVSKMNSGIIKQQQQIAKSSRAEAIKQQRYQECNVELSELATRIREESAAKGNPSGKVTFGTGPTDVDLYLGFRFMELQKRCKELESHSVKKVLKEVKDIPAVTW